MDRVFSKVVLTEESFFRDGVPTGDRSRNPKITHLAHRSRSNQECFSKQGYGILYLFPFILNAERMDSWR